MVASGLRRSRAGPAMQPIADWLRKLGLGQYTQCFAENDINFSILPDLTDQDLKDLGVASLGHRRLLLRAIAELKVPEEGPSAPAGPGLTSSAKADTAERRQVTVMFSSKSCCFHWEIQPIPAPAPGAARPRREQNEGAATSGARRPA